jgi:general secretion pathway protein A
MDYFRILNLRKEPFSNSPEPEFFFQAARHVDCLQKLELGIRLHRGLHVVIGPVGTGKTTLCRELIARLAREDDGGSPIETRLVLDPSFSSPLEFLSMVAGMFGIRVTPGEQSEWQIKEDIKNDLFEKGVREKKTVVLIVDEGQKLPDFCIEILREFLNYETNDRKLLQIVIFAQDEFAGILKDRPNFTDRVNLFYSLGPLSFMETQSMIRFRIRKASALEEAPPSLFTPAGYWAVYRVSGGYPRKIINLCHQVILALIIQNRSKAGWLLVHSCARRVEPSRGGKLRWAAVGAAVAAVLLIALVPGWVTTKSPDRQRAVVPSPTEASVEEKKIPLKEATYSEKTPVKPQALPKTLGTLTIRQGRTVWWRLNDIYGQAGKGHLDAISRANPHIRNINRISAGETVHLPALRARSNPLASGRYWVRVASGSNLEEAYRLFEEHRSLFPALWFVPYWNSDEGLVFAVLMKDGFGDEDSARTAMGKLPAALSAGARVTAANQWKADTVFFTGS